MTEGTLTRWAAVRQMLSTYADEAGYLSLQTYHTDRSGEQVGHFEVTPSFIQRWTLEKEEREGSIDLEDGTISVADEEVEDEGDSDDEESEQEEAEGSSASEETEGEESDGEDSSEAQEPSVSVDAPALINAVRRWLYETCEDNTPPGETQRFRLRIHSPKGARQLWSSILDYESGKEKPRTKREPVELTTYERKPRNDAEDETPDYDEPSSPPSPKDRRLSEEEIAFSELLMEDHDDDLIDFADELPPPTESSLTDMSFPQSSFTGATHAEPPVVRRRSRKKGGPTTPKGAPSQAIQSLMHLHKSHKEFIDTVMATTKQLVKVQAGAMDQLSGTLGDARNRENDLIQVIQGLRIAEAESAVEAAKQQDASQVRAVLGKEAISQMGLLGQVLLNRGRIGEPSNGASNGGGYVQPVVEEEHAAGELDAPDNGAHLYPDVSEGVPIPTNPELEAQFEQQMISLLGWAEARPDVLAALNDPAVRAYLRTNENVDQLRSLAQMFAPDAPPIEPVSLDLESGVEATPETDLDPETLEPTTSEASTDEND